MSSSQVVNSSNRDHLKKTFHPYQTRFIVALSLVHDQHSYCRVLVLVFANPAVRLESADNESQTLPLADLPLAVEPDPAHS